jgi:ankyrin repeat protein
MGALSLVDRTLDLTLIDPAHRVSLLYAACRGGSAEPAGLLLEHGASPNHIRGGTRQTPMHLVCERGDEIIVNLLLAHGDQTYVIRDCNGNTPKEVAEENGHREIAQLLNEHLMRFRSED